jgi:hypothetical protein
VRGPENLREYDIKNSVVKVDYRPTQIQMSLTYKGIIGLLIAALLKSADIPVAEGAIEGFIDFGLLIITAGIALYGRWRHKDTSPLGYRV